MSLDRPLLVRQWPERRPVVLSAAAAGLAAVFAATHAVDDPATGVGLLALLPVMLIALELGLAGGLAGAALALAVVVAADAAGAEQLGALGLASRAVAFAATGAIAGRFSDRMRAAQAREQRLLDSGLDLAGVREIDQVAAAVATAALRMPRAVGAAVEIDGAPAARAGRSLGERTVVDIVARGARLGALELVHEGRLGTEDRAALELLALQAGLAADNQRLAAGEREAAALEAELTRVRDELLEQRSGLSRVLEAQEDERRAAAETLREDLAQMLAAVLLGLRMLRRGAAGADPVSVDAIHEQVVGVLQDVRAVAATLRPSSLGQLGLAPALEALAAAVPCDLALTVGDGLERLTEPLRTGVYRVIEQLVLSAPADGAAHVHVEVHADETAIRLVLPSDQPLDTVRAARARVAMLDGTLVATPSPDHMTRITIRIPLPSDAQDAATPRRAAVLGVPAAPGARDRT